MPFFNEKSGAVTLAKGYSLTAHMQAADLLMALGALRGVFPGLGESRIVPFPVLKVRGGRIAILAFLEESKLASVRLSVVAIGQKTMPPAEQQRAFLFSLIRCKDLCPDTQRSCRIACAFGSVTISTDPRTGSALARIAYH